MKVADLIKNSGSTGFSFEILPPLKGSSIEKSFKARHATGICAVIY